MSLKTDCFAYREIDFGVNVRVYCDAYTSMKCKDGECEHYRTEQQICEACNSVPGRLITCEECRKIRRVV